MTFRALQNRTKDQDLGPVWGSHARGILAVTGQRVAFWLAGGMTYDFTYLPTLPYLVTDLGRACLDFYAQQQW